MTTSSEPSSLQDQKGLCFQRFLAKFPTAFCLNERLGRGRLSGQWAECGIETCLNFATHSIFHPSHDTAAAFWKRQFRILLRSNLLSNSVSLRSQKHISLNQVHFHSAVFCSSFSLSAQKTLLENSSVHWVSYSHLSAWFCGFRCSVLHCYSFQFPGRFSRVAFMYRSAKTSALSYYSP